MLLPKSPGSIQKDNNDPQSLYETQQSNAWPLFLGTNSRPENGSWCEGLGSPG